MKNLYLFYGAEDYLLQEKVNFWKKNFREKHGEYNLSVINGLKEDPSLIISECESMPFLGEKRLVILENLPPAIGNKIDEKKANALLRFITDIPETTVLLFIEAKPDKRTKFFKQVSKIAEVEEFKCLEEDDLQAWVLNEIAKREGKILPAASLYLTKKTGANLWMLHNEINKLIAYTNGKPISENDIDKLVSSVYDINIFKLTDYIGSKQGYRAIDALHKLVDSGNNSFQIYNMIVRQFRIFLQLIDLQNKPPKEIASILKLHPFVVQSSLKQLSRFKKTELIEIYDQLLKIDIKLKTGEIKISTTNENMFILELERFILKFAN